MHDPHELHLTLIKWILWDVKDSLCINLTFPMLNGRAALTCAFQLWLLGDNLVSWSSKCLSIVSGFNAEAEYRVVAHVVAECCWLRQLFQKLRISVPLVTVVYCDNVSVVYMTANPIHHRRMKHIDIGIHFVREKVALR